MWCLIRKKMEEKHLDQFYCILKNITKGTRGGEEEGCEKCRFREFNAEDEKVGCKWLKSAARCLQLLLWSALAAGCAHKNRYNSRTNQVPKVI